MPTAALHVAHRMVARPLAWLLRPTVTGTERVPHERGVVLAANHTSNLDNYLLSAVSPRPVAYLGKAELSRGVFGAFNRAMGMVPVARGRGDVEVLERVAAIARAGGVVAVFPEGTRTTTGALFRFRSGLARIAHLAQVDVIPVGIRGASEVWPRGRGPIVGRPRPGLLAVHFGRPVPPPDQPRGGARRTWTEHVRAQVAALSGQPLADSFAPIGDDTGP